jgi:catecholate siderophore receptor
VAVQIGEHEQVRLDADFAATAGEAFAWRLNGVYEDAGSYRDFVTLERMGVNPTAALRLSETTILRLGYEYLSDERTVDRGVPSRNGRPYESDAATFFGNPDLSFSEADVSLAQAALDHEFSARLRVRNRMLFGAYDKAYQNVHANSAVDALGNVALQAYGSTTDRRNFFNQTDLILETTTGSIGHTVLAGVEYGRQQTDNTRTPNAVAGSVNVASPTSFAPVDFGGALQTDNHVDADLIALYLQDQIALSPNWLLIAGVRYDRFELDFDDRRPASVDFTRTDELVSPRLGLVYKPAEPLSLYASYSVSHLPQSGDQFASLSATSAALEPERFENAELGLKWDALPNLAFTAALYRLERDNTTAIDPATSLVVQTGAQVSEGFEMGVAGAISERWEVIGGYAYQEVEITSATTAAPAGRRAPLTPEHVFSLWNNVHFSPRWGAGLGLVHQSDMFASISNAVTLPSFTRVDAALFVALTDNVKAQLNIENLLDEAYWGTAHNDNNITPGAPRSARLTLRARF